MKITRVDPILIAVPFEHGGPKPIRSNGVWDRIETLLVRVETDTGIVGWGEAFGNAVSPVTLNAIANILGPLMVGQDPTNVAALVAQLQRKTQNMGRSGPIRFGISGIDIALWDIAGQVQQLPLHHILGGAQRTRVTAYASFFPYGDVEVLKRNVGAAMGDGFRAIKLHEKTVTAVAAARSISGPDFTLMLDTNCAWTFDEAAGLMPEFEKHGLTWVEEPIYPPDDYEALARLRDATSVKIAAGENVGNAREALRIAKHGALDILQPSVVKIGGIVEMREAIGAALAHGVTVRPHSPFVGPGLVATLHVLATMTEADPLCERWYCTVEASVLGNAIDVVDGFLAVPQGPGLGIIVDEDVISRYRIA